MNNECSAGKCRLDFVKLILILGLSLAGLLSAAFAKDKWDPIPPEDLAATECKAYPGSSAEFLLEKRVLDYTGTRQVIQYFRRIKIYSAKGAKEEGVFGIEYLAGEEVGGLAARLTKPNGTSTVFGKKDFTESMFAKLNSLKLKKQTLAIPDLGEGDVLELKWTETSWDSTWWYFQESLPVRHFVFSLEDSIAACQLVTFNKPKEDATAPNTKSTVLELHNIPPYIEEPYMPPTRDVRGWFLLLYVYSLPTAGNKNEVWKEKSARWEESFRNLTKPNAAIKEKAAELLKGIMTDDEKLRRLYEFCQREVVNFDYSDSAELQVAKKKLDNRDGSQIPAQTLKLKTGYSHHINELFAALAKAAGYEVLLARSASRLETCLVQHPEGWLFVPDGIVVVKAGGISRYFAPGDYYVPAGMLDQANESAPCLITDPKKIIFVANPVSPADKSPVKRKGRFTLDAEGNLAGDIEISMDGHEAIVRKNASQSMQQEEIDSDYRTEIAKRLPAAEVSDLHWENLKGNKLPLVVRYKLKVPAYADVAGSKFMLSPNVFERGGAAVFFSETRKYPVYFDHAWSEHDDIEIAFPEGYTLEAGSSPASYGDLAGVAGARYQVGFKPKARTLVYKRDFALGGNGSIAFQAASYPKLKQLFDAIKQSDEHTMVLKLVPATPVTTTGQPSS